MKYLLIPAFLLAGALSANAHCGSCEAGEAHAHKTEAKTEKSEMKACCAKDAKKSDETKAACCTKSADAKKCKDGCEKPCCKKEDKAMKDAKAPMTKSDAMPAACCAKPKA